MIALLCRHSSKNSRGRSKRCASGKRTKATTERPPDEAIIQQLPRATASASGLIAVNRLRNPKQSQLGLESTAIRRMPAYGKAVEMSMPLQETAAHGRPELPGLSSAQAASLRAEFGPNAVVEESIHPLGRFARHFWAPVPWMLEATIGLQIILGEWVTASMIAAVLLFNVLLAAFQESRANAALALLKRRLTLTSRVRRDGAWVDGPAADLVPGDIVQVSLGDVVPADVLIVDGSLLLDQSMLTGESIPIEMEAGKTAFAGGLVRRGAAIARVTATGTRTYFGRTAELVSVAHVESAEQKAVLSVVRNLTVINFVIVAGLVAYAFAVRISFEQILLLVLTALLSAVPVALPATFTLAAALGARAHGNADRA